MVLSYRIQRKGLRFIVIHSSSGSLKRQRVVGSFDNRQDAERFVSRYRLNGVSK